MFLQISDLEFNTFFLLTIILIIVKLVLCLFLGIKIYYQKKEAGIFHFGFIFGVFIFVACMLISRIMFFYFDFFLTKFHSQTYYQMPNLLWWKIAMLINTIGATVFIFITDLKIFDFKLKGLLAYVIMILGIIQFIYPVNNSQDFEILSYFDLRFLIVGIMIPIYFFYLAWKPSPYRIPSITLGSGIILYILGALITAELILNALAQIRILIYFISLILKVLGLFLFVYGVSIFTVKFSK